MSFKIPAFLRQLFGQLESPVSTMANINDELVAGEIRRLDEGKGFSADELTKISSVLDSALGTEATSAPLSVPRSFRAMIPGPGLTDLLAEATGQDSHQVTGISTERFDLRGVVENPVFVPSPPSGKKNCQISPRVITTSTGNTVLVAHEQVLIKIISAYYSDVQPVGYSLRGLRLIHATTKVGKVGLSPEFINLIDMLKHAQLFEVTTILAKLLLPSESHGTFDLLDTVHPEDCFNVVDELMSEYVDAHTIYIVVSYLAEGGREYIEPFMPFNILDKNLWDSIEDLCSNGSSLDCITAPVGPRTGPGLSVGFITRATMYNPPQSKTIGKTVSEDQPILEEIVDVASKVIQARNMSRPSDAEPVRTLLDDGRPRGPPIIRDTVRFREGAANNAAVVQRILALEEQNVSMSGMIKELTRMVQELLNKVTNIDEALNTLIVQHSQSDLIGLSTINQSLMIPPVEEVAAHHPVVAVTGESSSRPATIEYLISVLTQDKPPSSLLSKILPDVKAALSRVGRNELASALCEATLEKASTRGRLVTQLKSLP